MDEDPLEGASGLSAVENFAGLDTHRVLDVLVRNLEGMVFRCAIDPTWTMLFVSSGCMALTGYSADELILNRKFTFEELTRPRDMSPVRPAFIPCGTV